MFQIEAAQRKLFEDLDELEATAGKIVAAEALMTSFCNRFVKIENSLIVVQGNLTESIHTVNSISERVQQIDEIVQDCLTKQSRLKLAVTEPEMHVITYSSSVQDVYAINLSPTIGSDSVSLCDEGFTSDK